MNPAEGLSAMVSAGMQAIRLEDVPTAVTRKPLSSGPETIVDGTQRDAVIPSITAPEPGSAVSSGVFASSPAVPVVEATVPLTPAAQAAALDQRTVPTEVVDRSPRGSVASAHGGATVVVVQPAPSPEPPARGMGTSLAVGAVVGSVGLLAAWLLGWLG